MQSTTKQHLLTSYYLLMFLLVISQVVLTIYEGSVVVHHGQQIAQLQQEKTALQAKRNQVTASLLKQKSLTYVAESAALGAYQPIAQPLVITDPHSFVASTGL